MEAGLLLLAATLLMCLVRAGIGPTMWDRLLAANTLGTAVVLFLAVYGCYRGRLDFLDVALVYALINFTGTVAFLEFCEREHRVSTPSASLPSAAAAPAAPPAADA